MTENPARGTAARMPSPATVVAIAAGLFVLILALKLLVRTPGFGFPLLYDIPVALVAIAFGSSAPTAACYYCARTGRRPWTRAESR